jgi:hypothetical protein
MEGRCSAPSPARNRASLLASISKRAERGIASAYEEVKCALVDLSEAYTLCASRTDFERKLVQFMARHGKRSALVRRLADAGLWKKA